MQISIRKALPSDGEAIVRFQEEMAWQTEGLKLDHLTVAKVWKLSSIMRRWGYIIWLKLRVRLPDLY
jgi:hypothetical protein